GGHRLAARNVFRHPVERHEVVGDAPAVGAAVLVGVDLAPAAPCVEDVHGACGAELADHSAVGTLAHIELIDPDPAAAGVIGPEPGEVVTHELAAAVEGADAVIDRVEDIGVDRYPAGAH